MKTPTNEKVLEQITVEISKKFSDRKCSEGCGDILVVDDNEFNRFILIQLLTKYKFNCKMVPFPPTP